MLSLTRRDATRRVGSEVEFLRCDDAVDSNESNETKKSTLRPVRLVMMVPETRLTDSVFEDSGNGNYSSSGDTGQDKYHERS